MSRSESSITQTDIQKAIHSMLHNNHLPTDEDTKALHGLSAALLKGKIFTAIQLLLNDFPYDDIKENPWLLRDLVRYQRLDNHDFTQDRVYTAIRKYLSMPGFEEFVKSGEFREEDKVKQFLGVDEATSIARILKLEWEGSIAISEVKPLFILNCLKSTAVEDVEETLVTDFAEIDELLLLGAPLLFSHSPVLDQEWHHFSANRRLNRLTKATLTSYMEEKYFDDSELLNSPEETIASDSINQSKAEGLKKSYLSDLVGRRDPSVVFDDSLRREFAWNPDLNEQTGHEEKAIPLFHNCLKVKYQVVNQKIRQDILNVICQNTVGIFMEVPWIGGALNDLFNTPNLYTIHYNDQVSRFKMTTEKDADGVDVFKIVNRTSVIAREATGEETVVGYITLTLSFNLEGEYKEPTISEHYIEVTDEALAARLRGLEIGDFTPVSQAESELWKQRVQARYDELAQQFFEELRFDFHQWAFQGGDTTFNLVLKLRNLRDDYYERFGFLNRSICDGIRDKAKEKFTVYLTGLSENEDVNTITKETVSISCQRYYRDNDDALEKSTCLAAEKLKQAMSDYLDPNLPGRSINKERRYHATILLAMAEAFLEQNVQNPVSVDDCYAFMASCNAMYQQHNTTDQHWYNKTNRFSDALTRALFPMTHDDQRKFSDVMSQVISQKIGEKLQENKENLLIQKDFYRDYITSRYSKRSYINNNDQLKSDTCLAAEKLKQAMSVYLDPNLPGQAINRERRYRATILLAMAEAFLEQNAWRSVSVNDCYAFMASCNAMYQQHNTVDHHWYNKTNRFSESLTRVLFPMEHNYKKKFSGVMSWAISQKIKKRLQKYDHVLTMEDDTYRDYITNRFNPSFKQEGSIIKFVKDFDDILARVLEKHASSQPDVQKNMLDTFGAILGKMKKQSEMMDARVLEQIIKRVFCSKDQTQLVQFVTVLKPIATYFPEAKKKIDSAIQLRQILNSKKITISEENFSALVNECYLTSTTSFRDLCKELNTFSYELSRKSFSPDSLSELFESITTAIQSVRANTLPLTTEAIMQQLYDDFCQQQLSLEDVVTSILSAVEKYIGNENVIKKSMSNFLVISRVRDVLDILKFFSASIEGDSGSSTLSERLSNIKQKIIENEIVKDAFERTRDSLQFNIQYFGEKVTKIENKSRWHDGLWQEGGRSRAGSFIDTSTKDLKVLVNDYAQLVSGDANAIAAFCERLPEGVKPTVEAASASSPSSPTLTAGMFKLRSRSSLLRCQPVELALVHLGSRPGSISVV